MKIEIKRAGLKDAQVIWTMQRAAFQPLFEKYHDTETSPAMEDYEKTVSRLQHDSSFFYLILTDGQAVGALRVVDTKNPMSRKRLSPVFILPEYQNLGIGKEAIRLAEEIHGTSGWQLDTILQEKGNCHLYEKMGYKKTGESRVVNDRMTLIIYEK